MSGADNERMRIKLKLLCACAALGWGAAAHADVYAMSEPAYEAEKKKIEAQYAADRNTCARLAGSERAVCEKQAKGREKADSARLEARYRPSPEAVQESKKAIAEAHHEIAMERCDALKGKAESRCEDEAKAALEAAIRQARVEKVAAQREAEAKARQAAAKARKEAAAGAS